MVLTFNKFTRWQHPAMGREMAVLVTTCFIYFCFLGNPGSGNWIFSRFELRNETHKLRSSIDVLGALISDPPSPHRQSERINFEHGIATLDTLGT